MTDQYTLYGMAASLYTGKVRAYMRHNRIPFCEEKVGGARFDSVVKPHIGRWIIPVVETPQGEFIQDGTDILDYFERRGLSRKSIYPTDPRLGVVARVFELFGGEGLLRPAMHYRWNFDDVNLAFLKTSFEDVMPDGLSSQEKAATFEFASGRMRKATTIFGVTPETQPLVETSYAQFLALMNAHVTQAPFLLGAHPTIGDYGLFNALYAHLGRDPKPLHIMQTTAPRVFRWVERMNAPEDNTQSTPEGLAAFDMIPATLKALMKYIAEEYVPEITAHIAFTNNWLAENTDPNAAFNPKKRTIGMAHFAWRGVEMRSSVMPYRQYLLQRIQDSFDALNPADRADVERLFADTGLTPLLHTRATRRIKRENFMEVWDT